MRKKKSNKAANTAELGTLGLSLDAPVGSDMAVPSDLRGAKALKTFKQMESDPTIGSFLYFLQMTFRSKEWLIESHDGSSAGGADADFVTETLKGMSSPFSSVVSEALRMAVYGFSLFEIVYKIDNGKVVWRKFAPRAQVSIEGWDSDNEGGLKSAQQTNADGYNTTTLPIEKLLLFRPEVTLANAWGKSLLIPAYEPWYLKRKMAQVMAVGIERDLAGIPIVKIPAKYLLSTASQEDKNFRTSIESAAKRLRRNQSEYMMIPSTRDSSGHPAFEIELLKSAGSRQYDLPALLQDKKVEILMTLLSDFLILGHGSVGTYALGVSKSDLLLSSLEGLAKAITDVVNAFAIPRLMALNGNTSKELPKMVTPKFTHLDLTTLTNFLRGAGINIDDPETQNHLRRRAELPERDYEAEPETEPEAEPEQPVELFGEGADDAQ